MSVLYSWISKLLASILVAVLVGATITVVVGQTVLNSHYLENRLASTNSYNRLSGGLAQQISQQAGFAGNPQVTAQLSTIVSPTVLRQKINTALDQLHAYYYDNGPQPTIDLTSLAAQAQAAGIPVPPGSGLTKPIVLSSGQQTQNAGEKLDGVRSGTIVAALLLTAALLALSWRWRKWAILPNVLITVGVLVGLLALAFGMASGLVDRYITFGSTGMSVFAAVGRDLATNISSDIAHRLGIAAAIFAVVGIGTRVLVAVLRSKTPPVQPMTKAEFKQTIQA